MSTTKRLYSLEEVAEQLDVSAKTVRRLIAANHLRGTYVGRQVRVRPEDLDFYLEGAASKPQTLLRMR